MCLVHGLKEGGSFNHLNIFSSDVLCVGDLLLGLNGVDCSTLTDLHSSPAVPEVEVISLLGEELPRYRLRADYLTEFGGYANSDFADASVIETPCLPDEDEKGLVGLTAEQAEATLEYLISSGYRLSQMTKTYHDVEAVTR